MKKINMYMCGPTLFDYVHIGCYRGFIMADIIHKHYVNKDYTVNHGMNIMDLDDKITGLYKNSKNFSVEPYYKSLKCEFDYLNLEHPNRITKTTECIEEIENLVDYFIEKGLAWRVKWNQTFKKYKENLDR